MIVLAKPFPNYDSLRVRVDGQISRWKRLFFYDRGRDALVAGVEMIGLKQGDIIIVPAFICDSIVKPLEVAGYQIFFLEIEMNLEFDPKKLEKAIKESNAKALLVVHYFGWPSKIDSLLLICKSLGVRLIEDCSHSFLTRSEGILVGQQGDAAIFSMRKTLSTSDGGALLLKESWGNDSVVRTPKIREIFFVFLTAFPHFFEKIVAMIGWPNIYAKFFCKLKILRDISRINFHRKNINRKTINKDPSLLLLANLADEGGLKKISSRIIKNYLSVIKEASSLGLQPFMQKFPDGCVPQWAILYDPSEKMVLWLRKKGVGACKWPWREIPSEVATNPLKYPVSNQLNRRLVLLPVHQSIGPRQIKYISSVLKSYVEKI